MARVRGCLGVILTLSLTCLTGGPAIGQDPAKEAAQAALKEYESYAKHRNPHVRKAALDTLGNTDHYLVTAALLAALKDEDSAVRETAIVGLEKQQNTQSVADLLAKAWRGQNKPERLSILKSFQRSRPKIAYAPIQEMTTAKDWEIRAAAAELIGVYPDDDGKGVGTLLPMLSDKEALVRLAAMDGLGALSSPRAQTGALQAIADPDWRVKASAIKVMRELRQKSSIDPLIELLKTEKGRLLDDATQALVDLTGRDVPADHAKWSEWWGRAKEGFKVLTKEELAAQKKKQEATRSGYDPPKKNEYPPYHGIKTKSRNLLYVMDVSASMAEVVTLDDRDKAGLDEFQKRYGELRIKIDIAREELINNIVGLPSYARFNIVTFNANVDYWKKELVPADDGNKNAAVKWLAKLTVANIVPVGGRSPGQTNTFEALNAAFGLVQGQEIQKSTYKTDADTMFLLSDGMPTTGRIVEPQPLLDYVKTVNRRAKMVIHCIAFGSSNRVLMEQIALESGGIYVKVGS